MRGASLTFILIAIITASLTLVLVGWTVMNTMGFFEINEINSIKHEFEDCNDKIIETARTGLSNTCMFSADRGQISGTNDDISYQIITHEDICDQTPWVLIEPEKNLWQKCDVSLNENMFSLKWNYTSIKFQFMQMGNVEIKGESGRTVEIDRSGVSDTQTDLTLKIY
jgi:hypothetical protein